MANCLMATPVAIRQLENNETNAPKQARQLTRDGVNVMSTSIISQVIKEFQGDALSKVASALGESPAKVQTALGGAVPALFGALSQKASTTEGAGQILELIRRNSLDSGQFTDISKTLASRDGISSLMNVGQPLLDGILGGRGNSLTDWVSSQGGISRNATSSLLSMVLPMLLAFIGRNANAAGGGVANLMGLFSGQSTFLKDAPAGLASVLGFGETGEEPFVGSYEKRSREAPPVVHTYETQKAVGGGWWKWALPLLALVALLAFFLSRRPSTDEMRTRTETVRPSMDLGPFAERKLPSGAMLNIPASGIESKLLAFIEDPGRQVDRDTWFSFDRLEFETDSHQLRPSSREQLRNIAEILKAYPNVNVKIGGYTDNVGDDAYNMKLSGERATTTMNELAALGIERSRLEAEGYGKQFPVADNATEEGRQRNRRIDILVTKK